MWLLEPFPASIYDDYVFHDVFADKRHLMCSIDFPGTSSIRRVGDQHVHSSDITSKETDDSSDTTTSAISIASPSQETDSSTNKPNIDCQLNKTENLKPMNTLNPGRWFGEHRKNVLPSKDPEQKCVSFPQGRRRRGGIVSLENASSPESDKQRRPDSHSVDIE